MGGVLASSGSIGCTRAALTEDPGTHAGTLTHRGTGLALALLLCVALPLHVGAFREWSLCTSLLLTVTLVAGARLTLAWMRAELQPMRHFLDLFVYAFLGLGGLAQSISNTFPWGQAHYSSDTLDLAALIVFLGYGSALVGYALRVKRTSVVSRPAHSPSKGAIQTFCVAAFSVDVALILQIGLYALFHSRDAAERAVFGIQGHYGAYQATSSYAGGTVKAALLSVPALLALLACLSSRRSEAFVGWPLTMTAVAMNVIVNNPISNSRLWAGTVLVSVYVAVFGVGSRAWRIFFAGSLVFVLVLFPYSAIFRHRGVGASPGLDVQVTSLRDQLVTNGDFDSFQQIDNAVLFVKDDGYRWGAQALGLIGFAVPRSLWTGKAEPTGVLLAQHQSYPFTNLSAPLWAEAYVDFGWAFVIIVLGIAGYVAARLDLLFMRSQMPFQKSMLGLVAAYSLFLLRGPLIPAAPYLVTAAACYALLGVGTRAGTRRE